MLSIVKLAMRITTTAYDTIITMLINAACADLGIVDVEVNSSSTDPLLQQAVITYVRMNFGTPEDYDDLKKSYDEQKAQLIMNANYGLSDWLEETT